jgi:excisionase family DNA binding protein
MQQTQEEPSLLTLKEAMAYLRVSRSTLYRLMWAGSITGRKVGRTWRFYRHELALAVEPQSIKEQER